MDEKYFVRLNRPLFEAVSTEIDAAIRRQTDIRQRIKLQLAKAAFLCADLEQRSTDDAF